MLKMRRILSFISLCIFLTVCTGCANIKGAGQENSGIEGSGEAGEGLEERADGEQAEDRIQSEAGNGSQNENDTQSEAKSREEDETQSGAKSREEDETQSGAKSQNENEIQSGAGSRSPDEAGNGSEGGIGTDGQQEANAAAEKLINMEFTDVEPITVYTTANVNVRLAPSTEGEILQKASRGTVYEKDGEGDGWSRISIEGKSYYIKSDYLREKKAPGEGGGHLIAIDAGHQSKANTDKEPLGPGSSEMKMKVSGGTRGTTTGLYEYELTLTVSQKLKAELESRGYEVYMVRESHDVDISNSQRAQMAYDSGAEVFVRIHANGSENSAANGAMTICPTAQNPYVAGLYADSRRLSDTVLDGLTASTGCKKERVWETDTMSGINWSMIPVTIVEMGYMTNPEEDIRLADDGYQQLIAIGIADGIDSYFAAP
ncbi:N-acetylmuramoyl-L-alanine amidase LytC [Muribaculaceae bacterium]|nr:N-acetylmuramoyl-L-alanine amidase LytC [Lachnospiraceae bacterium]GFI56854.1 N-acetylmuramoyl-L-alanine amidase LytC [Muribaculaceae bacterium]